MPKHVRPDLPAASPPATHDKLAGEVRRHIASGAFVPGDRYLSIRELARRYRVSPVTAQRTVRELAGQGVLEVRGSSGTYVGTAAIKSGSRLRFVQVMMPNMLSLRQRLLRQGLQEGLLESLPGVSLQIHFLPDSDVSGYFQELYGDDAGTKKLLGAVLLRVPRVVREFFARRKLPAVVVGHVEDHINLPSVDRDQQAIGKSVIEHLLGKGHRRFGVVMLESWNPGDNLLVDGIQKAMAAASLPGDAMQIRSVPEEQALIRVLVSKLLEADDRPSALVCRSDVIAIEAVAAVQKAGLDVPGDVAVVSVGADGPILKESNPPITTMSNDDLQRGRLAGELLMEANRAGGHTSGSVTLPTELIERGST